MDLEPRTQIMSFDVAEPATTDARGHAFDGLLVHRIALGCTLALAAGLTLLQLSHPQLAREDRVRLERYLGGTADRPFAFRVLVPLTVRAIVAITPDRLIGVFEVTVGPAFAAMLPQLPAGTAVYPYFCLAAVYLVSLLAYAHLGRRLYAKLFPGSRCAALVEVGLLVLVLPICLQRTGHIYDFSVLVWTMALLSAIASERPTLYLEVFCVSCLNKETTLLAGVVWLAFNYGRLPRGRLLILGGVQAVVFMSIYLGVRLLYANNAGHGMEYWLPQQLEWWGNHGPLFYLGSTAVVWITARRFAEKPALLRRGCWMLVPHLALCTVGAAPGERRNLYESLPLVSLLVLRNVELLVSRIYRAPEQQVVISTPRLELSSHEDQSRSAA